MTLVAAIDRDPAEELVSKLCRVVAGFKLGIPLLLRYGAAYAHRLRKLCRDALWIADLKLADIGSTMVASVEPLLGAVDAFIAHAVVGVEGALDQLANTLEEHGTKLVLVVAMSHPGASSLYNKLVEDNIEVARRIRAWGVVAPATMPELVALVRSRLPEVKVFSPGVGAQGAKPGDALCAGADYEIVGRLITSSPDPLEVAKKVLAEQKKRLERCWKP
ncbi:orotidine-5'-phosphate decarboxylase [Hyperthermus butylicus]|uniref:Orotidine 5'-phosphate decarboxylase n=1 Tax=Hyperthermus butylicus (strain DSM 5456 / JCM 9403 / PLM1-5) TaxID=415426 RepID=A2BJ26_HYPBU|nr:orotidine-5'-phosphate decarboxylase [Hyperthermus butylicus]ABM79987.1 Orotidine-5'-phosphate decarboxylase [Hyperthermus butylicus DSM 5456]